MPSTPETRTSKHGSNRNAQRTKQRARPSGPLPSPAPSSSNKVDDAMVDPPELLLDLDRGVDSAGEEINVFIAAETPPEFDVEAPVERKSRDQTVASVVGPAYGSDYRVRTDALVDLDSDEQDDDSDLARHTRSPVMATGSRPDTLSRKLQSVQSLISSPPRFPSPANISLLSVSAPKVTSVTASGSNADRQPDGPDNDDAIHTLRITSHERRESIGSPSRPDRHASYASQMRNDPDTVTFANFSSLGLPGQEASQLLFVGYRSGLQIWDTTNLGEVKELVNVRDIGTVLMADILPHPAESPSEESVPDGFAAERPLIGIVSEHAGRSTFIIYSLSRHRVVKTIPDIGTHVASFQASSEFIIISTHSPHTLHILSTRSLKQLHLIPSHFLASSPVQSYSQPTTPDVEIRNMNLQVAQRIHSAEVPVFAVSSHLLAYASPSRSSVLTDGYHPPEPIIGSSPSVISLGPVTLTQADISSAAMKVGGGILSGVKALGNFAITAARGDSNMNAPTRARSASSSSPFFSRSAPTSSGPDEHLAHGHSSNDSPGTAKSGARTSPAPLSSSIIKVVDLRPLLDAERDNPNSKSDSDLEVVSQFVAFEKEFVTGLRFSGDGVSLAVIPKSGHCVKTFKLRPRAALLRHTDTNAVSPLTEKQSQGHGTRAQSQGSAPSKRTSTGGKLVPKAPSPRDKPCLDANDAPNPPWNMYNLRRGLTEGVIEHVHWANDERWILFGTRKRTVHVFATNPYGGSSDEKSHIEGKVRNTHSLQPFPVDINPITRLRAKAIPVHSEGRHLPPITFALVSPPALPNSLLPNLDNMATVSHSLSSSPQKAHHLSPRYPRLARNFRDVLIFDPLDGQLTLQRLVLSVRPLEQRSSTLASVPIPGGTSISLPGMSVLNRLSPPYIFSDHAGDKLLATELVAKKSVVANWSLLRQNDWPEVKAPPFELQKFEQKKEVQNRADWLVQVELTTCSRSSEVLPTTIYLSHQFSFRAFDEDYHALIRCYNFDIPTSKIKVRKEVEAGFGVLGAGGQGDPFIEARSDPRNIRHGRTRSTFDEPLALAISADLDYSGTSPPVIPMLPNGIPGRSFKSAIPIKAVAAGLSDGMTEGFGLLKREIGKVRSPKARPVPDHKVSVVAPLEFDEEDEDFQLDGDADDDGGLGIRDDAISRATSGDSGGSISTPSTNPIQLASHDQWDGWGLEEDRVIEEIETFDEISAAGFMDEELARLKNVGKRG